MKTFLFIDGTNLYAGQYELFGPKRYLDFPRFIQSIQKHLKVKFDKIYFYASYSPKPSRLTKKVKQYLKNEGLFYKSVRNTPKVNFFRGYRSPTSGKEKEVDVKLAVDIVHFAHENRYGKLYLLSGDADFFHPLIIAKSLKKEVAVICLQNKFMYRAPFYFTTILMFLKTDQKIFLKHPKKFEVIKINPTCADVG